MYGFKYSSQSFWPSASKPVGEALLRYFSKKSKDSCLIILKYAWHLQCAPYANNTFQAKKYSVFGEANIMKKRLPRTRSNLFLVLETEVILSTFGGSRGRNFLICHFDDRRDLIKLVVVLILASLPASRDFSLRRNVKT